MLSKEEFQQHLLDKGIITLEDVAKEKRVSDLCNAWLMERTKNCFVIIPVRNGWEDTKECLESVYKSTIDVNVVLVDGGSNDETVRVKDWFPRVEVLRFEQRVTFSHAINAGVEYCKDRAKSFILLNNDTVVAPDTFERLSKRCQEHKSGIAAPIIYEYGTNKIWAAGGRIDTLFGIAWHNKDDRDWIFSDSWATGCCVAISKECWESVGGFDESMPWYCSDVDFCLRAWKVRTETHLYSWRLWLEKPAKVWHKIGQSSNFWWQIKEKYKSGLMLFYKHSSPLAFPVAVLGLTVQTLIKIAVHGFKRVKNV